MTDDFTLDTELPSFVSLMFCLIFSNWVICYSSYLYYRKDWDWDGRVEAPFPKMRNILSFPKKEKVLTCNVHMDLLITRKLLIHATAKGMMKLYIMPFASFTYLDSKERVNSRRTQT